jgi:hypothetical protein
LMAQGLLAQGWTADAWHFNSRISGELFEPNAPSNRLLTLMTG